MRDPVQLTDGVVRVVGSGGQTAGAGFVVTADGLIATCAHVIQDGGSPPDAPPMAPVTVVFQATRETRHARIQPTYWRDCDHGDVAFLQIEGPLPAGVNPLALARVSWLAVSSAHGVQ